jgi:hypothetical protein
MKLIVGYIWGAITVSMFMTGHLLKMEPMQVGGIISFIGFLGYCTTQVISNWDD